MYAYETTCKNNAENVPVLMCIYTRYFVPVCTPFQNTNGQTTNNGQKYPLICTPKTHKIVRDIFTKFNAEKRLKFLGGYNYITLHPKTQHGENCTELVFCAKSL